MCTRECRDKYAGHKYNNNERELDFIDAEFWEQEEGNKCETCHEAEVNQKEAAEGPALRVVFLIFANEYQW